MDNAKNGSAPLDTLPVLLPLTQHQMRTVLARQVEQAGGVRAFARKHGFSTHAPVSLALSGERQVSEVIANACGYLSETTFRPFTRAAKAGAS